MKSSTVIGFPATRDLYYKTGEQDEANPATEVFVAKTREVGFAIERASPRLRSASVLVSFTDLFELEG
jgi:hypothetical protein